MRGGRTDRIVFGGIVLLLFCTVVRAAEGIDLSVSQDNGLFHLQTAEEHYHSRAAVGRSADVMTAYRPIMIERNGAPMLLVNRTYMQSGSKYASTISEVGATSISSNSSPDMRRLPRDPDEPPIPVGDIPWGLLLTLIGIVAVTPTVASRCRFRHYR